MGLATNLTAYSVGEHAGTDIGGLPLFCVSVKATFEWAADGTTRPCASDPIVEVDQYAGEPTSSGLLRAAEVGPSKPLVDVLLAGELVFPAATEEIEVALFVGQRICKTARVFGERVWVPGVLRDVVPCRPRPVTRMPMAWERCFGGSDPKDAKCSDLRNPAGSGMRSRIADLQGLPAPNFEDPRSPIRSAGDRPAPHGFGPIAPFWNPRVGLAGTYDAAWYENRRPLLPVDFDAHFFNCAPSDQQVDGYLPGEEVQLVNMTGARVDRFRLPALDVPVAFAVAGVYSEGVTRVDTVVIEPARRHVSLVARASCEPWPSLLAIDGVFVGPLSKGRRRAIERGKQYVDLARASRVAA